MKEDIMRLTFPNYESASQRSGVVTSSPTPCISEAESTIPDKYNLYCVENITPLLSSTGGLIGLLLSPYAIAPITLYLISSLQHNSTLLEASSLFLPATALICLVNIIVYTFDRPISHISGRIGFNSIGATTLPGLYHSESSFIVDLLAKCPLLTASTTIHGSLPLLPSTPWILSGDMRTLLPFLSYKPRPISYIRRWVSKEFILHFNQLFV